jgi:DivIVA domain-containing protein
MIDRIEHARFSTTLLRPGYDEREVDQFLDKIVQELREELPVNVAKLYTASFTHSRRYPGYVIPDVHALLDEIVQYAYTLPRSGHEAIISRIRNSVFRTTRLGDGYDEDEVHSFFNGIVKDLNEGRLPDPMALRTAAFTIARPGQRGYVIDDVHGLLGEIEQDIADR